MHTYLLTIAKSSITYCEEQPEGDVMQLSDFIISPTNRNVRRH